jgi:hypothetical protein
MDSLKIGQLVVVCINTDTEEESSISSINDFVVPEL